MSKLNQGRILVTGGAGFIGSAHIWALNERGMDNILTSDRLEEKGQADPSQNSLKYKNLKPLRFAEYIEADKLILLAETDDKKLKDIRCVLHFGANSSTTETDLEELRKYNYEYTKTLAHWALKNQARFVYASSAATYGDGAQGMDDRDPNLTRLHPLNAYGLSKHRFDLYAQQEGLLDAIVGLKYFNVFGPNEDHKGNMRSVVHKAFGQIRDTGRVQLFKSYHPDYPDGGQQRDFLYIKDALAMTLHLAESNAGGLFNLGSGQAHTWLELVTPIFTALGLPPKIEFIEMPESLRAKYQYFTQAGIEKLRATGYTAPITPLADAVTDYVRNYLAPGRRLGDEPATASLGKATKRQGK